MDGSKFALVPWKLETFQHGNFKSTNLSDSGIASFIFRRFAIGLLNSGNFETIYA